MTTIEGYAFYDFSRFVYEMPKLTVAHDVLELASDQAPVAARFPDDYPSGDKPARRVELRTYGGDFYQQALRGAHRRPMKQDARNVSKFLPTVFGRHATEQQARKTIEAGLANIVLIDGTFWIRIPEPVLGVAKNGRSITAGSDIWHTPARSFALTEPDAAVEAARALWDQHDLTAPDASALDPGVEVLIPSAFTLAPNHVRMSMAQDEAEADARRAIALLGSVDAGSLHEAGTMLIAAAARLDRVRG